ncbi:MAG TPA: hypothetical protein VJ793_15515 [Anaerolineae bacterium]|nr:hypothetical protein [Anaerolineae bacterium]
MPTVVCDSGPLIALAKLNRLDLLSKLWDEVNITRAVYDEVVTHGLATGAQDAPVVRLFWRQQRWPIVAVAPESIRKFTPASRLDVGEMETLSFALETDDALVLIDDAVGRREARRSGLRVKGTLGVIADAYRRGHLTFFDAELLIREIESRPDIWIRPELCEQVLERLRAERRSSVE